MELDLTEHRYQHRYIIGKTGAGKSTALLNFIIEDIENGDGIFYIDPHGHDTDTLLKHISVKRRKDVILFDPSDDENPIALNILENVKDKPFVASSIVVVCISHYTIYTPQQSEGGKRGK